MGCGRLCLRVLEMAGGNEHLITVRIKGGKKSKRGSV